jgi:uncharacterized protein (DUF1330 family)
VKILPEVTMKFPKPLTIKAPKLLSGCVVVRFPSTQAATAWYRSPEYASLREVRLYSARGPLRSPQELPGSDG